MSLLILRIATGREKEKEGAREGEKEGEREGGGRGEKRYSKFLRF